MKRLGLDNAGIAEIVAVVDVFNGTNRLANAYQVEPDVSPDPDYSIVIFLRGTPQTACLEGDPSFGGTLLRNPISAPASTTCARALLNQIKAGA